MPKNATAEKPADVGRLSEATIIKTTKWVLQQFKKTLGAVPSDDKRKELVEKLKQLDICDPIQEPTVWYIQGSNERAYIYGNRIALSGRNSLEHFADMGFDSTGIITPRLYDMDEMAEKLFPGEKDLVPCGMGLRVEIKGLNQVGHNGRFPHVLNRLYPYDIPLQEEIKRRGEDIIKRCENPATAEEAISLLTDKLAELYPDSDYDRSKFTLHKPSRQSSKNAVTHFLVKYHYEMLTHSGRKIETHHDFRANIGNIGFKLVPEDLTSYGRNRKAEGVRRKAYTKYQNGIKLSRLAANVIDTLTAQQMESLLGGGCVTFKRDDVGYDLEAKKLEIKTAVRFDKAVITDKGAQIMVPIPASVCEAMIGESLRRVIDHPLITDDMIITKVATVLGTPVFTYKAPTVLFKE